MNPSLVTPVVLGFAAVALVCEVIALFYCSIRNVPFGRAFGGAVFVQISIPAALLATMFVWEYFSPSALPADSFGGRGWGLLFAFFAAGLVATIVAGALGVREIFLQLRRPHAKNRNA